MTIIVHTDHSVMWWQRLVVCCLAGCYVHVIQCCFYLLLVVRLVICPIAIA